MENSKDCGAFMTEVSDSRMSTAIESEGVEKRILHLNESERSIG